MHISLKNNLQKAILDRSNLYDFQGSRLKRLTMDPMRTLEYYVKQYIAYLRPYRVTKKTLWGESMSYYLPEAGMVYYYGFWEVNLANFFINFIQEDDVFLDIGAHVGYYSMLASWLTDHTCKVYSFEPTPRTYNSLKINTETKSNIKIFNNAVLDKETTIEFFDYGPKYSAFNSFKKRNSDVIFFKDSVTSFTTKTIAIDDFCAKENIIPTFIKIDAEGSEYLILDAMKTLIKEHRPSITIEVSNDPDLLENSIASVKILQDAGYLGFIITKEGYLKEDSLETIPLYDNFLFVHPTKKDRISHLCI